MEILIFGILAAGAIYSWTQGDQVWKSLAEELDFTYTSSWVVGRELHGHRRGFEVEIKTMTSSENQDKPLRIEISGVDPGFTLGRDSAIRRMIKPDIETGDQLFDQRTRVEGDADWALALLGDETRRLAEMVVSGWNGQVHGKTLVVPYEKIEHTASTLDTALDLAQRLRQPALQELPTLLVQRACHDPSSSVQLQAFRRLTSSHALRDEALEAAEALLDASSAPLQLEACRLLVQSDSEKGDLAAENLAALATRASVDSSVRRSALETLGTSRYRRSGIAAMSQLLKVLETPPRVRSAALDGLIRAKARRELVDVRTDDDVEAETLARGLGRFDASAQPKLLQLLVDSADPVRMAAVKSLGRVGDLDAVRVLRQIADQGRVFKSALSREAELAITRIKSRSNGSQQGEISIITVAPLEGAISPSDDSETGGEVSLTS